MIWSKADGPRKLPVDEACDLSDLAHIETGSIGCIYVDPPWSYGNQSTRNNTDKHYDDMTIEEIKVLPISRIAADRSHLFLWTTNAFHNVAYDLLAAWGFEDKGYYVWVKPQMGMGNYFRVSHEVMLLGVKGGVRFNNKSTVSWGNFSRGKHSAKPPEVRKMIEIVSLTPRLELFSRDPQENGWVHWGREITKTEFIDGLCKETM